MKIVSVSVSSDFSQFQFIRNMKWESYLHDDAIKLLRPESFRILLSCANYSFCYLNFAWITKFKKMKEIAITSSCKWPITCTSKDKHGDRFSYRFKELTCAFRARKKIWHTRYTGDFGTRGMQGMNFLLEPTLLEVRVRRSRNLKICLQGMQISAAYPFKCKNTLESNVRSYFHCIITPVRKWKHGRNVRPFPSSPGPPFQNEGRCSAFDMEIIFHSQANKT